MKLYSKFLDFVEKILKVLIGIDFAAMLAAMVYLVVKRYIFHNAPSWCEEFARFGFLYLVFLACPIAVRRGQHLQVDFISSHYGPIFRHIMSIVSNVCGVGLLFYISFLAAMKMTDGIGVDLCVVSGIADDILDQAAKLTRKGGDICLASMITKAIPFHSYEFARKEQYLYGTLVYTTEEFEETVDIVNSCQSEELEKFITHVFPFDETQTALEILDEKRTPVLKVLVELVKE